MNAVELEGTTTPHSKRLCVSSNSLERQIKTQISAQPVEYDLQ